MSSYIKVRSARKNRGAIRLDNDIQSQPTHDMLIDALQNRTLYDHPVEDFHIVETHISWVLLTGPYAYKIKKPVNLGFLDFSTLAMRRHFCHEELRLNRRLAPQLYLKVISITGSNDHPQFDGPGEVIEYAVKMRQFPGDTELERVLERGQLEIRHIEALAARVAAFHRSIPAVAVGSDYGLPHRVWGPIEDNFNHIRTLIKMPEFNPLLSALHDWSKDNFTALQQRFAARRRDGFVRECHGDMHLGNMILLDDEIIVFDCLEFNPALRWIDMMSEIAFLTMDLDDRHQSRLGWRFLNHYLENTGDYEGLELLRFYQAYRAMVRAKVTAIRLGQGDLDAKSAEKERRRLTTYLELAQSYTCTPRPVLIITHGFSGSGKSLLTTPLADILPAIRIRSDVERKRLFGLAAADHSASSNQAQGGRLYSADASRRTYERLAELAASLLRCGFSVIVDATFLRLDARQRFRTIAENCSTPFSILDFQAPETLLRKWISERMETGRDASDAGIQILEYQMQHHDPITDEEQACTLTIDTAQHVDVSQLYGKIRELTEASRRVAVS